MDIASTCANVVNEDASNNIMCNSSLLVFNTNKSNMNLISTPMVNESASYVTIQNQNDMTNGKFINGPVLIQNIPNSQDSQTQNMSESKNYIQMASLTPSQIQSLSYLLQSQLSPQILQTNNGIVQVIPQFNATQSLPNVLNQTQSNSNATLQTLPAIGLSLNNFTNQVTTNNGQPGQSFQLSNIPIQQLIPIQQIVTENNYNTNVEPDQPVTSVVDLNDISSNQKKKTRRKRKTKQENQVNNLNNLNFTNNGSNTMSKDLGEGNDSSNNNKESQIQYDNKGRPFSFFCTECPKKFTLNSRLSAHMRCHTGMRPFTCSVCGFSFTQKSYLIRHAAVHKEERPFHCENCQKSYKHYGSLANHRKLHKKEKLQSFISNASNSNTNNTITNSNINNNIIKNEITDDFCLSANGLNTNYPSLQFGATQDNLYQTGHTDDSSMVNKVEYVIKNECEVLSNFCEQTANTV